MAPLQPYYIINQIKMSPLQLESLTHFYQPIIGPIAMSVYLTFINVSVDMQQQSERYVHNQLLDQMQIALHDLDNAFKQLEAIGLMRTYRDRESHEETRRQTLYYQMIAPLDPSGFIKESHLRALLFYQIGPHNYQILVGRFTPKIPDLTKFDELTTSFNQMYQIGEEIPDQALQMLSDKPTHPLKMDQALQTFDYSQFLGFVMANQVDHSELTVELKQNVLALHQMFKVNESQMAEVVKLATNQMTGQIEQAKLNEIVEKRMKQNQSVQPILVNNVPKSYTVQEADKRRQEIKQHFQEITDQQISIILLCEQMPIETFLKKTKEAKGGFPNDEELFYVQDLQKRSALLVPTINLLVYYLLAIQGQANVYKGSLQRTANDWQQKKLTTPETIFQYLNKQEQIDKIKQKQSNYRNYPNKKKYTEPIPEWLQKQNEAAGKEMNEPQPQVSQQAQDNIRSRLAALYREEEEG